MILTGSQFAKFMGTSRQNIYKLVRNGKLTKDENNNYCMDNELNLQYCLKHSKTISEIKEFVLAVSEKKNKKDIVRPVPSIVQEEKIQKKEKVLETVGKEKIKKNIISEKKKSKRAIPEPTNPGIEIIPEITNDENIEDMTGDQFENITGLPQKMMNMSLKNLIIRYGTQTMLEKYVKILNMLFQSAERDNKINERQNLLIPKEFTESKLFFYLEILNNRLLDYPENIIDKIISFTLSDKETARIKALTQMRIDIETFINDTKNKIDNEIKNIKDKYQKENDND